MFYPAGPSDEGDCPNDIENAANAEWRDDMAALEAIASVAHTAAVSWAAIGAAVHISRQSAHERWSSK